MVDDRGRVDEAVRPIGRQLALDARAPKAAQDDVGATVADRLVPDDAADADDWTHCRTAVIVGLVAGLERSDGDEALAGHRFAH